MITKGKLAIGLASAGAVAALLPASAGANATCVEICGGGTPPGVTTAIDHVLTNPSVSDLVAEKAFPHMLAANHNETVLSLA